MQDELEGWFGRKVDLVKDTWIQDPVRRNRILETRKVWGAARLLLPLAQTQLECIIPATLRQGGD